MDGTSTKREIKDERSTIENERLAIVQKHYERKGYRVHSGLQFGCHLVLYTDTADMVHSDYCVHIVPQRLDWTTIQTLVRSMSELHKRLIIVNITKQDDNDYIVNEIMIGTEHAPMRQKKHIIDTAGLQLKKQKLYSSHQDKSTNNNNMNNDVT